MLIVCWVPFRKLKIHIDTILLKFFVFSWKKYYIVKYTVQAANSHTFNVRYCLGTHILIDSKRYKTFSTTKSRTRFRHFGSNSEATLIWASMLFYDFYMLSIVRCHGFIKNNRSIRKLLGLLLFYIMVLVING